MSKRLGGKIGRRRGSFVCPRGSFSSRVSVASFPANFFFVCLCVCCVTRFVERRMARSYTVDNKMPQTETFSFILYVYQVHVFLYFNSLLDQS